MATITEYTGEMVYPLQVNLGAEPAILITVQPDAELSDDPDDLPLNLEFSLLSIDEATALLEAIVLTLQAAGYGQPDEEED